MTLKKEKRTKRSIGERIFPIAGIPSTDYFSPVQTSEISIDSFSTINNYYELISGNESNSTEFDLSGSFAVRLSRYLIDIICTSPFSVSKGDRFGDDFYIECMKVLDGSGLMEEAGGDGEILVIHLKQMVQIMRECGIISSSNGTAIVSDKGISNRSLFFKLLNSFWNDVDWADIFPSNPDTAKELKTDRNILKDLLLRYSGRFELNTVSNEFFELTGLASKNDMLTISFLDFYLLTWLKHFNILSYYESTGNSPICVELTEGGKRLLASINN